MNINGDVIVKFIKPKFIEALKFYKQYGNSIDINYSGSGDDGWIDSVIPNGFNEQSSELFRNVYTLTKEPFELEVEEFAWQILCEIHQGWENNAGASGSMVITFIGESDFTVKINHEEYYTESNTHVHQSGAIDFTSLEDQDKDDS